MKKLIYVFLAIVMVFPVSCNKEDSISDEQIQENSLSKRLDLVAKTFAPGTFVLEKGAKLVDKTHKPLSESLCPNCPFDPITCITTIEVTLTAGSVLLVDGVGAFNGPTTGSPPLVLQVSFASPTIVNATYGGKNGVKVNEVFDCGIVINRWTVNPSARFRIVSKQINYDCTLPC